MKKYTRSKKYRRRLHKLKTQKGGYFWRRSTRTNFNKARTAIVNAKMNVENYCTKIKKFAEECSDCDKNILINDMKSCSPFKPEEPEPKKLANFSESIIKGYEGIMKNEREKENQKK
jgi:hypothetical protein